MTSESKLIPTKKDELRFVMYGPGDQKQLQWKTWAMTLIEVFLKFRPPLPFQIIKASVLGVVPDVHLSPGHLPRGKLYGARSDKVRELVDL